MPYSSSGRLGGETASKLGHLDLTQSAWVRDLVDRFDHAPPPCEEGADRWLPVPSEDPLTIIWAVDGSLATVRSTDSPPREVSFVKTALLRVERAQLDRIDPEEPHPLLLQRIMKNAAIFQPAVFPLRNIDSGLGTNYDAVRHIVRDTMLFHHDGAIMETLKWLVYQEWNPDGPQNSPSFECPHGTDGHEIDQGFSPGSLSERCRHCDKEVFLTDLFGLHLDMADDTAPVSIATSYMLVAEHLMLLTPIRLAWNLSDKSTITRMLFLKDGPLTLRSQYSKLVPPTRKFVEHARTIGRPVHIVGQEKSGAFADYLETVALQTPPHHPSDSPHYRVLSHRDVRSEVQRSSLDPSDYGKRVNWGEKVLLKIDPHTRLVLSIPTGEYLEEADFPQDTDIVGLHRILSTLLSLVSRRHENALFPIELAHGVASLSSYPGSTVLQRLVDGKSD